MAIHGWLYGRVCVAACMAEARAARRQGAARGPRPAALDRRSRGYDWLFSIIVDYY